MSLAILIVLWLLNAAISFWNSYAVGRGWAEAMHARGFPRIVAWCGAAMTAAGFTWCIYVLEGPLAYKLGWIDTEQLNLVFELGYLVVAPVIVFSGIGIWLKSWSDVYHNRTVANMGVAGYNTFAQAYNTYNLITNIGDVVGKILKSMSKSKDGAKVIVPLLLLIVATLGGVFLAYYLINKFAASDEPMEFREEPTTYIPSTPPRFQDEGRRPGTPPWGGDAA